MHDNRHLVSLALATLLVLGGSCSRLQQLKLQQLRLLERYMWQLPPAYRDVLRHRLAEGDDSSWAEQRNIAVSTVRWQYARACKLLGQLIKRAGVTNPSSSGSVSAGCDGRTIRLITALAHAVIVGRQNNEF